MKLNAYEQCWNDTLKGTGNWPGWSAVYDKLSKAAQLMADSGHLLSDAHIETMAALGSGHEETMKYQVHWLYTYGWIT